MTLKNQSESQTWGHTGIIWVIALNMFMFFVFICLMLKVLIMRFTHLGCMGLTHYVAQFEDMCILHHISGSSADDQFGRQGCNVQGRRV